MFLHDQQRKEIKQRLRETREQKWRMSQAEMAEFLRGRLDPSERKYPSERTYVRWESLHSPELPQSWKKLTQVASVMDIDLSDLLVTDETSNPPQIMVLRRLDTLVDGQQRIEDLLRQLVEGDAADPPPRLIRPQS